MNKRGLLYSCALRLLLIAATAGVTVPPGTVYAAMPVRGAAAEVSYWLRADGDTLLLTAAETAALNARIAAATDTLRDLAAVPDNIPGAPLARDIAAAAQDFAPEAVPDGYLAGEQLTPQRWRAIWQNCALDAVPERISVQYAVTVRRANVRLLPCGAGLYESPEETRYDALQGTVLDPGTPVRVFHTSADSVYGFICASDYCGWVRRTDIAAADREAWSRYFTPQAFAVVTAPTLRLHAEEEDLLYELGARIPLIIGGKDGTRRLGIPTRGADGQVVTKFVPLPAEGLSIGPLAPTHNNLMRRAFAPLGTAYGWGGEDGGMDCSSYVRNVYRAMGIVLPRDADAQERTLGRIDMTGLSSAQRRACVTAAPPGALLFRPGHVMLYLGTDRSGTPLVIHDISSYYEDGTKRYIRRVVVSDLNFQNARGLPAIDTLTHIGPVLP